MKLFSTGVSPQTPAPGIGQPQGHGGNLVSTFLLISALGLSTAGCSFIRSQADAPNIKKRAVDPSGPAKALSTTNSKIKGSVSKGTEAAVVSGKSDLDALICEAPSKSSSLAPARLRRLSRFEYNNTLLDLLGDTTAPGDLIFDDDGTDFSNGFERLKVSSLEANRLWGETERIAERALRSPSRLHSCLAAPSQESQCASTFVREFGAKAFRSPLSASEEAQLIKIYTDSRVQSSFIESVQSVLEAMLLSSRFLYRYEALPQAESEGGFDKVLASHTMASQLSYFFWRTMPDAELFGAAQAGRLWTKAEVEAQARRLLASPKALTGVRNFFDEFLSLGNKKSLEGGKDPTRFPNVSEASRRSWREETGRFVEHVVFEEEGSWRKIMEGGFSFVNEESARVYGLEGVVGTQFREVDLDKNQRAGLLTQPALMAAISGNAESGLVHRGRFLLDRFFCTTLPSPPEAALALLPKSQKPLLTAREKYAPLESMPDCSGCHKALNGAGYGLENYDAIGQFRTKDNGLPIDASGVLTFNGGTLTYDGLVDLSHKLAVHGTVHQCLTRQVFEFAMGRADLPGDQCAIKEAFKRFTSKSLDVKELMIGVAVSDAFRFRSSSQEGQTP